jgi:2-polyprenyl-3-methyl-5-hydroxy-6-metoxy-1,4-benzoquinol methylase
MKCRICENSKENENYNIKEMMFGLRDEFEYLKCAKCGCLQIIKIPKNLSKYYKNYHLHDIKTDNKFGLIKKLRVLRDKYVLFGRGLIGKFLIRFFPPIDGLEAIKKLNLDKETKILDVGCGTGTLLKILQDIGFNKTLGVDLYIEKDIILEEGLKIIKGSIFSIEEKQDLIIFNHSFEHISNPFMVLKHVSKILNNNGKCLIRIPIIPSFAWDYYGINWVQIDAPRHIFLHSINSMEILAKKSDFKIKDILYDSTAFQFWGSEQYKRDIPLLSSKSYFVNPKTSIFSKTQLKYFREKAILLNKNNLGDQAAFYFSKKD